MTLNFAEPTILNGGRAVDDRGALHFFNDLELNRFKRFYSVENHEVGFIRAWHGHLKESKVIFPIRGTILVCAVKLTQTENPDKDATVCRVVLSATDPKALFIPSGHANGFKTLTADSLVMVLSSTTLKDSMDDDYRYPFDYWNPWHVEQR